MIKREEQPMFTLGLILVAIYTDLDVQTMLVYFAIYMLLSYKKNDTKNRARRDSR